MKRIFFVSYFFIFFTVSGLAIQTDEQEKDLPVDEINKIRTIPVLFIFGVEEKSQVPAMLTGPRVLIATVPGDHRYNRDASIIVKTMKDHRVF